MKELKNIPLKEIYERACNDGIEDASLKDIEIYLELDMDKLQRGVCGKCSKRLTDRCPWIGQNEIYRPICFDYEQRTG